MNWHPTSTDARLAKTLRIVLFALFAALALGLRPAAADPQGNDAARRNSLTGNWYVATAAAVPPGQPPLTALQTYFDDGNLIEESNSSAIRSLGHGTWERLGHRQFKRTFLIFRFDAARNYVGRSERQATLELSHDGRTFTNLGGVLNVYDRDGNLLSSQFGPSGEVGVRFRENVPLAP